MRFSKVRDVKSPTRGTAGSAGLDFYVPLDFPPTLVDPSDNVLIPSGIKVDIPAGHALVAFNKSGIAIKRSLVMGACLIDEDYQGEIHLHLINTGGKATTVKPGDKIAQFVLIEVEYPELEEVNDADLFEAETERGVGMAGSTDHI